MHRWIYVRLNLKDKEIYSSFIFSQHLSQIILLPPAQPSTLKKVVFDVYRTQPRDSRGLFTQPLKNQQNSKKIVIFTLIKFSAEMASKKITKLTNKKQHSWTGPVFKFKFSSAILLHLKSLILPLVGLICQIIPRDNCNQMMEIIVPLYKVYTVPLYKVYKANSTWVCYWVISTLVPFTAQPGVWYSSQDVPYCFLSIKILLKKAAIWLAEGIIWRSVILDIFDIQCNFRSTTIEASCYAILYICASCCCCVVYIFVQPVVVV